MPNAWAPEDRIPRDRLQVLKRRCIEADGPRITFSFLSRLLFTRISQADGPAVAISSFASTATVRNGWNWVTGLDSFGFNYPLRAMVAGPYLGCNGEREAMYPIRYTDADGQVLNGKNKYVVKLEKEPPGQLSKSKTLSSVTAWTSTQLVDHPERKSGRIACPRGIQEVTCSPRAGSPRPFSVQPVRHRRDRPWQADRCGGSWRRGFAGF
jgi:hypothetical protein